VTVLPAIHRITKVLVTLLLLPIVVFVGILAIPFILAYLPFRFAARLWFRSSHIGHAYLMVTRSSGWAEFIDNNVLPVLPPNMTCVSDKHPEAKDQKLVDLVRREVRRPVPRPYLVTVGRWRCRAIPLHDRWLEWKEQARERSPQTQEKVRQSLAEALSSR